MDKNQSRKQQAIERNDNVWINYNNWRGATVRGLSSSTINKLHLSYDGEDFARLINNAKGALWVAKEEEV